MSKFYILMVTLLIIAIINLARALKEKKTNGNFWGVAINIMYTQKKDIPIVCQIFINNTRRLLYRSLNVGCIVLEDGLILFLCNKR